ncbi:MAG TPA: diguanylate cyclase, partial [Vicinamibacteria bacterium]
MADGVRAAQAHAPSLVLVALEAASEADALARALRADPRTRPTAIVVIDRGFSPDTIESLVRAGVNAVLPTPIDPFLWDRRLEELLTVPARREERLPVRLEDWSRCMREELAGAVVNIGARGALVESPRRFELGAKLGLSFVLPEDGAEVRVVGQVSRQAASREGLFRFGVEFLIYRGDARRTIAEFVERDPRRQGASAADSAFALSLKGLGEGGEWEEELRASELRKATILDSALDPIVTFDHEGRILEFNAAARRVFGYSRDEVVGRELAEKMVPPALREELRQRLREFVETGDDRGELGRRLEALAMRADGTEFPVELAVFPAYIKGRVLLTAFLRDLSERRSIEVERARVLAALRESEARITSITEAIPGAVYQFRIDPNGRHSFPFVSKGARELVGVEAAVLQSGDLEVWSLVTPEERARLVRSIQISARDLTRWNEVLRVATPLGNKWIRGESIPHREADGATVWNGNFIDVSDQKAAQEQLERLNQDLDRRLFDLRTAEAELQRLVRYDSLTGLSNRSFFLETLVQVLLRAERRKTRVGLIFVDLDGFKAVNDNLGHDVGDQLLRVVAERLRKTTRRTDSVARIGGDEFTVLLQD